MLAAAARVPYKYRGSLAVLLISSVITVLMLLWMGYDFHYLATAPIGDQGDTLLENWAIYQGIDNLLHHPTDLGNSTIYYNDPASFAYTTAPYGTAIIVLPVYLLTHNLELTYNLYFLVIWPLTAWAAYILIRYLLNVSWAIALFAALMVAFSQYRFVHIIHIHELCAYLVLLSLYSLHRLIDTPRLKWALALAVSFFFTLFTSGYLGMMFVLVGAIVLVYAIVKNKLTSQFYRYLLVACFVTAIPAWPFITFRFGNARFRQGQTFQEVLTQSPTIEELFSGSSVLYRGVTPVARAAAEDGVFFGFVPLILAVLAWRWRADSIISPADSKRRAFATREVIVLYGLLTVAAYLIVLGPSIRLGRQDLIPGPFLLLMQFPGFSGIRALARFILIAIFSTAVLSAFALSVIIKRMSENAALTVLLIIVLAFTLENVPYNGKQAYGEIATKKLGDALRLPAELKRLYPMSQNHEVPVYQWLSQQPADAAIFNYPAAIKYSYQYLIDIQLHNHPMLNGSNVAYYPDWYVNTDWDAFPTAAIMTTLQARNIRYLLIHHENMLPIDEAHFDARWAAFQQTWGNIPLVGRFGTVDVYAVTAPAPIHDLFFDFDAPPPGTSWYAPERLANKSTVAWTGPDADSTLAFSIATDQDSRITFQIDNAVSADVLASLTLRVNGQPVPLVNISGGDIATFAAYVPHAVLAMNPINTVLAFHVDHLIPAYPRTQALQFDWIRLTSTTEF